MQTGGVVEGFQVQVQDAEMRGVGLVASLTEVKRVAEREMEFRRHFIGARWGGLGWRGGGALTTPQS